MNLYEKSNNIHYLGNHANSLYIQAKIGSLNSNQITIEDCWKYDPTEYTTNQNVQIELPTDFEITANLMQTASSNTYPQLYIGTELGNNIAFGKISSKQGVEFKLNNQRVTLLESTATQPDYEWYTVTFRKQGNNYTFLWNNETLTYTNSTVPTDYLFLMYLPNGKCKNLKIQSL